MTDARREAERAEHIRRVAESLLPLSDDQRSHIAHLLRPPAEASIPERRAA